MVVEFIKNNINNNKAYTLIELMIVVSIIGVLSTVVYFVASDARDKARMGSAKMYEASHVGVLRNHLIAEWKFEEGSGTTTYDSSGLEAHASFVGSPQWSNDTYDKLSNKSLFFPFYSYLSLDKTLGIMDTNFSIIFWMKTINETGQTYIINNAGSSVGYRIGVSGGYLAFLLGNGVAYTEKSCSQKKVNDNKWHLIVAAFDRENKKVVCHIDGSPETEVPLSSGYYGGTEGLSKIGSGYGGRFEGYLDNVRFYSTILSLAQVQKLYAEESVLRKFAERD